MKIIKRVRYQRKELRKFHGEDYITKDPIRGFQCTASEARRLHADPGEIVLALDTAKYPPEVTWDVVGLPHEPEIIEVAGPEGIEQINVYKGGIETVYE